VGPIPVGGGAAAHALAEQRLAVTREHIEEQIAAFETACREAGMIHGVVRERGDPMEKLLDLWRYHDLTVFGLRGLFDYGVLNEPGARIGKLIARGVRPILAVSKEYRPVRRVLVAYDGSMESAKAMKRFVQMHLWPDVELTIACCGFDEGDAADLLEHAGVYCRAHGIEAACLCLPGNPKESLLEHVRESEADLVVMGSTSRSRIMELILGETVAHAMQEAEVPLFLNS
jgi:nucleotide-binding universal stress UspA family protein